MSVSPFLVFVLVLGTSATVEVSTSTRTYIVTGPTHQSGPEDRETTKGRVEGRRDSSHPCPTHPRTQDVLDLREGFTEPKVGFVILHRDGRLVGGSLSSCDFIFWATRTLTPFRSIPTPVREVPSTLLTFKTPPVNTSVKDPLRKPL